MLIPVLRPVALAIASLGLAGAAQAATYTVPQGAKSLQVTLKGAGGGAGGADDPAAREGSGGKGGAGASLSVEFSVKPGDVLTYEGGSGGNSGENYKNPGPSFGGEGGTGMGRGGSGGEGALSNLNQGNFELNSASGGGGGGGGASWAHLNGTLWARAGGGGGGGGGSWSTPGGDATVPAGYAAVQTSAGSSDACAMDGIEANGAAGDAGTGDRSDSPYSYPEWANRGGGGGGGGGGGFVDGMPKLPAKAGFDQGMGQNNGESSQGGVLGGSCYSAGITLLSPVDPAGGAAGQTDVAMKPEDPQAYPGDDGEATPVVIMAKAIATAKRGDGTIELGTGDPALMSITDTHQVDSYQFICTPQGGSPIELSGGSLPLHMPATNGTTYTCTVTVTVPNPNGGEKLSLLVSDEVSVTPSADAAEPPVVKATPVPGLGGWGVLLLSGLLGVMGLRRKRA